MTATSEVPIAYRRSIPSMRVRTGTSTTPPPSPVSDPTKPAATAAAPITAVDSPRVMRTLLCQRCGGLANGERSGTDRSSEASAWREDPCVDVVRRRLGSGNDAGEIETPRQAFGQISAAWSERRSRLVLGLANAGQGLRIRHGPGPAAPARQLEGTLQAAALDQALLLGGDEAADLLRHYLPALRLDRAEPVRAGRVVAQRELEQTLDSRLGELREPGGERGTVAAIVSLRAVRARLDRVVAADADQGRAGPRLATVRRHTVAGWHLALLRGLVALDDALGVTSDHARHARAHLLLTLHLPVRQVGAGAELLALIGN